MKYQIPEERLLELIEKYISTSYPNAIKVELAPPNGNISITSLFKSKNGIDDGSVDERDILIHKFDAYGMSDYKFNNEFLDLMKSMFGETKGMKKLLKNWYDNKPVDMDLLGSKKEEQNEGEITERCWKGYTQKGMKTMFGKRYPNCVKKK